MAQEVPLTVCDLSILESDWYHGKLLQMSSISHLSRHTFKRSQGIEQVAMVDLASDDQTQVFGTVVALMIVSHFLDRQ